MRGVPCTARGPPVSSVLSLYFPHSYSTYVPAAPRVGIPIYSRLRTYYVEELLCLRDARLSSSVTLLYLSDT